MRQKFSTWLAVGIGVVILILTAAFALAQSL
jgi:hypothetical protein